MTEKRISDIGKVLNEDERTLRRIIKLNDLIPELQELVSEGKYGTTTGEQLTHLLQENQHVLLEVLWERIVETTV